MRFPDNALPVLDQLYHVDDGLKFAHMTQHIIRPIDDRQSDEVLIPFDPNNREDVKARVAAGIGARNRLSDIGVGELMGVIAKNFADKGYKLQSGQVFKKDSHFNDVLGKPEVLTAFSKDPLRVINDIYDAAIAPMGELKWKTDASTKFGLEKNVTHLTTLIGLNNSKAQHCFMNVLGSKPVKSVKDKIDRATEHHFGFGIRSSKKEGGRAVAWTEVPVPEQHKKIRKTNVFYLRWIKQPPSNFYQLQYNHYLTNLAVHAVSLGKDEGTVNTDLSEAMVSS